jgi:hypothetical protein
LSSTKITITSYSFTTTITVHQVPLLVKIAQPPALTGEVLWPSVQTIQFNYSLTLYPPIPITGVRLYPLTPHLQISSIPPLTLAHVAQALLTVTAQRLSPSYHLSPSKTKTKFNSTTSPARRISLPSLYPPAHSSSPTTLHPPNPQHSSLPRHPRTRI